MRTLRTCLVGLLLLSGVGMGVAGAQVNPPDGPCSVDNAPANCNAVAGQEAALETWPMTPTTVVGTTAQASTPVAKGVLSRPRFTG